MGKAEIISGVLGAIFFLSLIFYSITSSSLTMFLHLFLLISGSVISILMTNKVTKSSNSFKSKLYFSFIISFILFFAISFFWMLGNHSSIDDKGLTTAIIIIPTAILFGIASFIVGLTLSLKRKNRNEFGYNLKRYSVIISTISLILFSIFFYNPTMGILGIAFEDENLCHATIENPNSYMFAPSYYSNCMMGVGIKTSNTRICDDACNFDDTDCLMNTREVCYHKIAFKTNNAELCAESSFSSYCISTIAKKTKNIQLCELLEGGSDFRVEFSDTSGRDRCLSNMAPVMGDKDICNLINEEETKVHCIETYDFYREKIVNN